MRKVIWKAVGIILTAFLIFLIAAPYIVKHLIEKYDVVYTGREIKTKSVHINFITGKIIVNELKVYELKSDSVFISIKTITSKIHFLKLLFNEYDFSGIEVNQPRVKVLKNKSKLNYTDLAQKLFSKTNFANSSMKLNWKEIRVVDGSFLFLEETLPIKFGIKNINLVINNKILNEGINIDFVFKNSLENGNVKGSVGYLYKEKSYQAEVKVENFDLNIVEQYMKVLVPQIRFSATLNADFKSKGIFGKRDNVTNSGIINLSSLHCSNNDSSDLISFNSLLLCLKEVSPKKKIFTYDSVILKSPFINYTVYDSLDNFQILLGRNISKLTKPNSEEFNLVIEISSYLKMLSQNFKKSNYLVDVFRIDSGNVRISDGRNQRKFSKLLFPINIVSKKISKKSESINAFLSIHTTSKTSLKVYLRLNPLDFNKISFKYDLNDFQLKLMNPYIFEYTSYTFESGILNSKGNWSINNGEIESGNHLSLLNPKVKKKKNKKRSIKVPVSLLLYIMINREGEVVGELPITGTIKNPQFKFRKFFWSAVKSDSKETK